MFCPKCGAPIPDGVTTCPQCGANLYNINNPNTYGITKPDTYLIWSIISTIFCCLPIGIVSIVYSASVTSAFDAGNYALAQENSRKARKWLWINIIVSLVCWIVYALIFLIYGVSIWALTETIDNGSFY